MEWKTLNNIGVAESHAAKRRQHASDIDTDQHLTLKTRPLKREHLDDFLVRYKPGHREDRVATWSDGSPEGRWRAYSYDELALRDKRNLDLAWLKDEALEESANLPASDIIVAEIVEDLRAALSEFEQLAHGEPTRRSQPAMVGGPA